VREEVEDAFSNNTEKKDYNNLMKGTELTESA